MFYYMKNIFKSALLLVVLCAFASCGEQVEPVDEYLEVTANNLSGDWTLQTWNDGAVPEDGVAVYIRLSARIQGMRCILMSAPWSLSGRRVILS